MALIAKYYVCLKLFKFTLKVYKSWNVLMCNNKKVHWPWLKGNFTSRQYWKPFQKYSIVARRWSIGARLPVIGLEWMKEIPLLLHQRCVCYKHWARVRRTIERADVDGTQANDCRKWPPDNHPSELGFNLRRSTQPVTGGVATIPIPHVDTVSNPWRAPDTSWSSEMDQYVCCFTGSTISTSCAKLLNTWSGTQAMDRSPVPDGAHARSHLRAI